MRTAAALQIETVDDQAVLPGKGGAQEPGSPPPR